MGHASSGVGTRGYWLALALTLLGIGISTLLFLRLMGQVSDMPRATMPGTVNATLPAGDTTFYAEPIDEPGRVVESPQVDFECRPADPSAMTLKRPSIQMTYSFGRHRGKAIFVATVPRAGDYTLTCTGAPFAMAWGASLGAGIVTCILTFFGGVLAGFITYWVTRRRRRRQKRERGAAT